MTSRKRNEFLDASGSEDEGSSQGYDSEAEDFRKGGRSPKRQKIKNLASDDSDEEEDGVPVSTASENPSAPESKKPKSNDKSRSKPAPKRSSIDGLPTATNPLSKKNLIDTEKAIKCSGIIYLSRIPPFMKPSKLRSLLSPYGTLNRIFLTPEDPASHTRRVKSGGNKKRSFTDGWVEFVRKSDAKKVCELLNARPIGGKKGGFYYDDVWNLLYLKNFKWGSLTAQIAAEEAERESRMRAEIGKTKRENEDFVRNVERGKMLEGMENKKAARRERGEEGVDAGVEEVEVVVKKEWERPRQFKQTQVAKKRKVIDQPEEVQKVLSKIF